LTAYHRLSLLEIDATPTITQLTHPLLAILSY
jgi:hypothetical protein